MIFGAILLPFSVVLSSSFSEAKGLAPACAQEGETLDPKSVSKGAEYYYELGLEKKYGKDQRKAIIYFKKAATLGSIGANWQIASMYDTGFGVKKNRAEALFYYKQVINADIDLGSNDEFYVSDALLKMGDYFYTGPGKDYKLAQIYYFQSASNFVNSEAQFNLGLMFLRGHGVKKNAETAFHWFQLSSKKGNLAGQAMCGDMLVKIGQLSYGLTMITNAYKKANDKQKIWIKTLQDEALALIHQREHHSFNRLKKAK